MNIALCMKNGMKLEEIKAMPLTAFRMLVQQFIDIDKALMANQTRMNFAASAVTSSDKLEQYLAGIK